MRILGLTKCKKSEVMDTMRISTWGSYTDGDAIKLDK